MEKSLLRLGVQWLLLLLLLASRSADAVYAQSSSSDANFLATLRELRDAPFVDKDNIVEKLGQSGHRNVQAVLTALSEDHLYFHTYDVHDIHLSSRESKTHCRYTRMFICGELLGGKGVITNALEIAQLHFDRDAALDRFNRQNNPGTIFPLY